eukprot:3578930-Rhodomonas_salina.1
MLQRTEIERGKPTGAHDLVLQKLLLRLLGGVCDLVLGEGTSETPIHAPPRPVALLGRLLVPLFPRAEGCSGSEDRRLQRAQRGGDQRRRRRGRRGRAERRRQ